MLALESSNAKTRAQRANANFRGSSKYASISTHQNEDQGRRDDLWGLLYVLIEFVDGALPWTADCANRGDAAGRNDTVLRKKSEHLAHLLQDGGNGLVPNSAAPPEVCAFVFSVTFSLPFAF